MATIINIFSSPVSWIIVGLALFNIFEWFGTKHTIAKLVEINRPEANIRIGRQANMNITDGCVDDLIKYSRMLQKNTHCISTLQLFFHYSVFWVLSFP